MLVLAKNTTAILQHLRLLMLSLEIVGDPLAAYIVPSGDAHHSLRMAPCDQRRAFLTGFNASAGTAVVTRDKAHLWTDARYFFQAEQQLDENWTLMKEGIDLTLQQWLNQNIRQGSHVGLDPKYIAKSKWDELASQLGHPNGIHLTSANNTNLVDLVWGEEKPACPEDPVSQLPIHFAGKRMSDKVQEVYTEMEANVADVLLVSELDEIAWLLNLRGSDLPLAPVFNSYVIFVGPTWELEIFIDPVKVSQEIMQNLQAEFEGTLSFYNYNEIEGRIKYYANLNLPGKTWISKYCNAFLGQLIPREKALVKLTPINLLKAVKNDVEAEGMKNAHVKDSAAIVRFLAWLEQEMSSPIINLTEISAADKLTTLKSTQEYYVGRSFPIISASGPNGAIIHYFPTEETNRLLAKDEMYLIDSGSHYLDGTTDITRTVHFGEPTEFQRETYTRVLKGHIAIATLHFPYGTTGHRLDSFARAALWQIGLDFGHNPSHGIGAYLNLAEGPQNIGSAFNPDDPGLRPNMFLSNEPGYYKEGDFGIRLENIMRVVGSEVYEGFVGFEAVSWVPFQRKLIKEELLSTEEVEWLNEYHFQCKEILQGFLATDSEALDWLAKETQPI